MRVSIIVSTRNRCVALEKTLLSLSTLETPRNTAVEIIVVDNGSTDATQVVLAETPSGTLPRIHLLEKYGGKSTALNAALGHAKGDILVMTDDDVIPEKDWLTELIKPITSGTADATTGTIAIAPHLERSWMRSIHRSWLASTNNPLPNPPNALIGANMAFHRQVLQQVPGFDPELGPGKLGLWEDTLFGLQLQKAGFVLAAASNAKVEHHFSDDRLFRKAFLRRALTEARSSAYVAWHWQHLQSSIAATTLWHLYLLLCAKRIVRWREWHNPEGAPEWELNILAGIEHARSFKRERLKSPNYSQFGLRRLKPITER